MAHQAYLEAELEEAGMDFIYPRSVEETELYTTYTASPDLLGRELDQQLAPQPPLDERIKAIVLLRHCHLDKEQHNAASSEKGRNTAVSGGGQLVENLGPPRSVLAAGGLSTTSEESVSSSNGKCEFGNMGTQE